MSPITETERAKFLEGWNERAAVTACQHCRCPRCEAHRRQEQLMRVKRAVEGMQSARAAS